MMMSQMNHGQLMHWINVVSFAVVDITEYLDTHPNDEEALKYFNHYAEQRRAALRPTQKIMGLLLLIQQDRTSGIGRMCRFRGKEVAANVELCREDFSIRLISQSRMQRLHRYHYQSVRRSGWRGCCVLRYLSQRYSMPYRKVAGLLTDIGTEELAPF